MRNLKSKYVGAMGDCDTSLNGGQRELTGKERARNERYGRYSPLRERDNSMKSRGDEMRKSTTGKRGVQFE
jgi:hypothetical protein